MSGTTDTIGVSYRRARVADAERTFAVVLEVADDLLRRNGRAPAGGAGLPPERVIRFRHACVAHDPDRFLGGGGAQTRSTEPSAGPDRSEGRWPG